MGSTPDVVVSLAEYDEKLWFRLEKGETIILVRML